MPLVDTPAQGAFRSALEESGRARATTTVVAALRSAGVASLCGHRIARERVAIAGVPAGARRAVATVRRRASSTSAGAPLRRDGRVEEARFRGAVIIAPRRAEEA